MEQTNNRSYSEKKETKMEKREKIIEALQNLSNDQIEVIYALILRWTAIA